jgi:hypothetical protein
VTGNIDASASGPGSREPDPQAVPALTGFDPSRISEAVELIEPAVLAPLVRKAADDFYAHVMEAAQDYLRDNIDFNLKSHLAMLEHENATFRRQMYEIGQVVGPPWYTHEERLERLRVMSKAADDLSVLRYRIEFGIVPSGDAHPDQPDGEGVA